MGIAQQPQSRGEDMIASKAHPTKASLIAPCGINCRLCRAYGRAQNPCQGCRASHAFQSENCFQCSVHCEKLAAGSIGYCFQCNEFPCKRLAHLDKRYRTRYAASPIDNLKRIQADGIRNFVQGENEKWACPICGALLCMHDPQCRICGHRWRQ